jgi:hypothetical protein
MNKKSLSFIIVGLLFSLYSSAQINIIRKHGTHLINDSTIIISGPATSVLTDSLYVINAESSNINVNARRDQISIVAGSDNYFCWYMNCFSPAVDSSYPAEAPCPIAMGDTNKTFYCDYNAAGNVGISQIRYTFMNAANRADTSWVLIKYNATPAGIQNLTNGVSFNIYPNPTNGNSTIEFNLEKDQNIAIEVYNTLGENAYTQNVGNMTSGKHLINIPGSGFTPGIYFVRIISDNGTSTQKLIIQK